MQNKQKQTSSFKITLLFQPYSHQQLHSNIFLNLIIISTSGENICEKNTSEYTTCIGEEHIYKLRMNLSDCRWINLRYVRRDNSDVSTHIVRCKVWSTYIHKEDNLVQMCATENVFDRILEKVNCQIVFKKTKPFSSELTDSMR